MEPPFLMMSSKRSKITLKWLFLMVILGFTIFVRQHLPFHSSHHKTRSSVMYRKPIAHRVPWFSCKESGLCLYGGDEKRLKFQISPLCIKKAVFLFSKRASSTPIRFSTSTLNFSYKDITLDFVLWYLVFVINVFVKISSDLNNTFRS